MPVRLTKLTLEGFKSVKQLKGFEPGDLTVFIGPNGAGKSNLVSFFRFLSWMLTPPGNLQTHVAKLGYANSILHDGVSTTPQLAAHVELESEKGLNEYRFRLAHAAGDTLIFTDEACRFSSSEFPARAGWIELGAGHREAELIKRADSGDNTAEFILGALRRCVVHQFHNTSETARMKLRQATDDNRFLKEDGANIAPVLLRLKNEEPRHYARIAESIRQVLPFFADFELEPEAGRVLLKWTEKGCDLVFGPDQASDGMLRVIQLWTLLLMPKDRFPAVLVVDEPELGLHPSAIVMLCGMLRSASRHCQVMAATQSTRFVDEFDPEQIVVVDRPQRESTFVRKTSEELADWLDEYTMSQLWEKNILGGKP